MINLNIIEVENIKDKIATSIALGNFDGVHRGHITLIKSMIEDSLELGLDSSILLFKNHTKSILKGQSPDLLTNDLQREEVLNYLGVNTLYKINFNLDLSMLTGEDFVKKILIDKLNVKAVTIGYDYKFGHKAQANAIDLKNLGDKYGFKVTIIKPVTIDNEVISSTQIRSYLKQGKIKKANNMLGRNYAIRGKVVTGKNLGHKLGFATANTELLDKFLIPKNGVYYSKTKVMGQTYLSVTSIGKNPTFDEKLIKIETHILDFNENIYGKRLEIEIIDYIREEMKFNNLDNLKEQIGKDIKVVRDRQ